MLQLGAGKGLRCEVVQIAVRGHPRVPVRTGQAGARGVLSVAVEGVARAAVRFWRAFVMVRTGCIRRSRR